MKILQRSFCLFILLICISNKIEAQLSFSHEIGVFAGHVSMRSDYGERGDNKTNFGNTGMGFGLVHYMNFAVDERGYFNKSNFFNDHFRLRSELSYSKSDLNHFGKWLVGKPSLGKEQLRAMTGSSAVTNLGMQLEFYPYSIRDNIEQFQNWAPFASIGAQYNMYNAKAESSLGELGDPTTTFPKYLTPTDDRPFGFSTESKSTFSIVGGAGTRYKIGESSDLMVELRLQYYFSDWVDGLKPNPDFYKENKFNDWQVWFNFGYIYHLY